MVAPPVVSTLLETNSQECQSDLKLNSSALAGWTVEMDSTGTTGAKSAVLAKKDAPNVVRATTAKLAPMITWSTGAVSAFADKANFKLMALAPQAALRALTGITGPVAAEIVAGTVTSARNGTDAKNAAMDSKYHQDSVNVPPASLMPTTTAWPSQMQLLALMANSSWEPSAKTAKLNALLVTRLIHALPARMG